MRHFLLCSLSGVMFVLGDKRLEDNEDELRGPALILFVLGIIRPYPK